MWAPRGDYGVGDGLTDPDPAAKADADAEADAEADDEPEGRAVAVALGLGRGVGVGMRLLGRPANESAKIRTNPAITITTQGRARASFLGGSDPR